MTQAAGQEHGRRPPGLLIIVLIVLVAVAVAAFFMLRRVPVRAIEYSVSEEGRVLLVAADACKGEAQIRAEETNEAVAIRATAKRQWFGGQTICEVDALPVRLDQPLGNRTVIDGSTGEPVNESSPP